MNKVYLHGRLAKDPNWVEGQFCKITVAVDKKFSKDKVTDFIPCIAFGKTAEIIGKNCTKGTEVLVEGEIKIGSYERNGQKIYTTDVAISEFEFCGSKTPRKESTETNPENFYMPLDDEGLPFN